MVFIWDLFTWIGKISNIIWGLWVDLKVYICINMVFVWTNILKVYKLVAKFTNVEKVYWYVVKLTNVCKTCDLTAQWTENVSKYKIEQLSVSLTCENFKYNIKFMCRSKSLHCT